jgi:glycosyltransferase involved in cell wall biosynthesis
MSLSALRRADAVVAVSDATARRLSELMPFPKGKIRVIPNGVRLDPFLRSDLHMRGMELRNKLGFTAEERIVLIPAALREGKGHEVALGAMTVLQQRIPSLRLVFAGMGNREPDLRRKAKPLGDKVVFLGDFPEMPVLFGACDLVVLPSMSEALPTALIEAAAAGCAAVATSVGGTPEVIKGNLTGLLVRPNDPEALAAAVSDLLGDAKRLQRFGAAARLHALQNFSMEIQVQRTLDLWSEVIGRRVS